MIKKKTNYSDEDKSLGYKAYVFYQSYKGNKATEESFKTFRFRKYFYELGRKYIDFNTEIPVEAYIKYLVDNNTPIKNWADINTFRNFLLIYTKEENRETAVSRSKEYLSKKGYSIQTISDNRLILYLENGNVSPWLVLTEYPEFFEEINKKQEYVFCRNILNYFFWKKKLVESN